MAVSRMDKTKMQVGRMQSDHNRKYIRESAITFTILLSKSLAMLLRKRIKTESSPVTGP